MNDIVPTNQDQLPMSLEDMKADNELGGKIDLQSMAIPYLYVLQTNSPQCNPDHGKYIKGATSSMLYLSNLEKIYNGRDEGLSIVPCHFERLMTEWKFRSQGGGLALPNPYHEPDSDIVKTAVVKKIEDKDYLVLPNGHQLVDTAYHYFLVFMPDVNVWAQCISPFYSTALTASRRMNTIIKTTNIPNTDIRAPRFLYSWKFTTVKEQKDNYIWSIPKLEREKMVNADVYAAAKAYAIIAAKGVLRRAIVESEQEADVDTTSNSSRSNAPVVIDDSLPL